MNIQKINTETHIEIDHNDELTEVVLKINPEDKEHIEFLEVYMSPEYAKRIAVELLNAAVVAHSNLKKESEEQS